MRLDTTYFAENWKHCSKIIFKCVKNYFSLFFFTVHMPWYTVHVPWIVHQALVLKKKKKKNKFKMRKENKCGRECAIQTNL